MRTIAISCVIPSSKKDLKSKTLKQLIRSIKTQDFEGKTEVLVITEGDSESAKAEGIRRAKGKVIGMFCADNVITDKRLFSNVWENIVVNGCSATYPIKYAYKKQDNSLNRYFSLMGGNDPVCYYLGKNDRWPHVSELRIASEYSKSYGCNGFFYRSDLIKKTDLNNYYPMDNAMEVKGEFAALNCDWIWHKTSDNLLTFLKKRYKYARDLYSDRSNRRWKMVDGRGDVKRLVRFAIDAVLVFPMLNVSLTGYRQIKDPAWFWHWPVSFSFLITYGVLTCRNILKSASLSRHWTVKSLLKSALSPSGPKHSKTTK